MRRHVYCSMCNAFLGAWSLRKRLTTVPHCPDKDACFARYVSRLRA